MKMFDLTVVLPSYNRCRYLEITLAALIDSVRNSGQSDRVEIIVQDNQSTDGTQEMVARYAAKFPVSYVRTQEFVTGDVNIFNAQRAGAGRYLWVLGDDDPPLTEAVAAILAGIDRGRDYLVLNYWLNVSSEGVLAPAAWFDYSSLHSLEDANEVLAQIAGDVGFISAIVARREMWLTTTPEEQVAWIPRHFHQVLAFYKAIKQQALHGELLAEPMMVSGLVVRKEEEAVFSWERAFVGGLGGIYDLLEEEYGYHPDAVAEARSKTFDKYVLPKIVYARIAGTDWRLTEKQARSILNQNRFATVRRALVTELPLPVFRLVQISYHCLQAMIRKNQPSCSFRQSSRARAEALMAKCYTPAGQPVMGENI